jgi:hypothetical protein
MYTTPQKNSSKPYMLSNMSSIEHDRQGLGKLTNLNSSVKQTLSVDYKPQTHQKNIPRNNILNSRDGFLMRRTKCMRGPSPRKYQAPNAMSFSTALSLISQNLDVDVSALSSYIVEPAAPVQ